MSCRPWALARWRHDPVAFVREALVDPETGQPFELYHQQGNLHTAGMIFGYVPKAKVLVQADGFLDEIQFLLLVQDRPKRPGHADRQQRFLVGDLPFRAAQSGDRLFLPHADLAGKPSARNQQAGEIGGDRAVGREAVLPAIARGLAAQDRADGVDLRSPTPRRLIEDAALLLLFRVLFFLYLEGREPIYLRVDCSLASIQNHHPETDCLGLLRAARESSPSCYA